jgi:hypothetical protein
LVVAVLSFQKVFVLSGQKITGRIEMRVNIAVYDREDDDLFQLEGIGNTPVEAVKDAIRRRIAEYPTMNSIKEKHDE